MKTELLKNTSGMTLFEKGQIIFEDGETLCEEMYILLKGSVEVYKNYGESNELKIATLKAGDFFGEMSLFLGKDRAATVVAAEDSAVLAIERSNAFDFIEQHPKAIFALIKTLCSRLETANDAYKRLYYQTHPKQTGGGGETTPAHLVWLLPEEHKAYNRRINVSRAGMIREKTYQCPICSHIFSSVIKVKAEPPSFRRPAKGSTGFYFDVVTCKNCWYSAFSNIFTAIGKDKERPEIFEENTTLCKDDITHALDDNSMVSGVFIKHYLALKCAPELFVKYDEIAANLWLRLSWLYHDCSDEQLELYAVGGARDAYLSALQKRDVPRERLSVIHFFVAELSFKMGDYKTADDFFYRISESLSCAPELRKLAVERIEDVQQRRREVLSRIRADAAQGRESE